MTILSSQGHFHVLRLTPGEDLKESLQISIRELNSDALAIVTCVGSLYQATLRFANQSDPVKLIQKFEIVSLTGTISHVGAHLHVAISDGNGQTLGGHLVSGSLVYTTAEIVLVDLTELRFSRVLDPQTGFRELGLERKI